MKEPNWTMAGYTQGSFFAVTPTDDFDFNQYDEVKELNENASPSVLLGFSLDTTNFKDQLTNCVAVYERYKGEFTEADRVMVSQLHDRAMADAGLRRKARSGNQKIFVNNFFPKFFDQMTQQAYTESVDSYTKLFEDAEKYRIIMRSLGETVFRELRAMTQDGAAGV